MMRNKNDQPRGWPSQQVRSFITELLITMHRVKTGYFDSINVDTQRVKKFWSMVQSKNGLNWLTIYIVLI